LNITNRIPINRFCYSYLSEKIGRLLHKHDYPVNDTHNNFWLRLMDAYVATAQVTETIDQITNKEYGDVGPHNSVICRYKNMILSSINRGLNVY